MKFKSVAEAFNYYKDQDAKVLDDRTRAIQNEIDTNPDADLDALNIELEGIKQAKAGMEERSQMNFRSLNPITGMNYNQEKEMPEDILGSKEYRSAFYKSLLGQKLTDFEKKVFNEGLAVAEKRANAFDTMTSAASVLPTQTLNEIVKKARTEGGLISVCRAFNIPSKVSVPVGTPSDNANWHTEGQQVDSDKTGITNVSFNGYEILKVMSLSVSAKKMSIEAFEAYIIEELKGCVMGTIENALVNGTGVDQGTGILNGITWVDNTNAFTYGKTTGMTFKDVVKAPGALKRGYAKGAVWAMNTATLYNQFYGMVDTNGNPIFLQDPKVDGVGKVLGFPVVVDDNLPTDTILFGNFNYMGYNLPEGVLIESSSQSSFRSALIDYRALAIADCKPIVQEAFIKFTRAV